MRIRVSASATPKNAKCTPNWSSSHDDGPAAAVAEATRALLDVERR
jgi:hypothetical protein